MPYYTDAKSRINKYHDQLEAVKTILAELINDEEATRQIATHIDAIQSYYNSSLRKAKSEKTQLAIIISYENYIDLLTESHKITHLQPLPYDKIEDFFKASNEKIGREYDARRISAFFHNCYKVCELTFWAAATISLYASIFLVALPMLIVQPTLGLAVSITVGGLFMKAASHCLASLGEFKGTARHSTEYDTERALLSFFQPKESPVLSTSQPKDTPIMQEGLVVN
ncbi:DUF5638 domain-containing protein [Legionella saoudiensis]|uniref:DUF5638 domain-containing protein n=1 Tax=Legionella saoudiensis TaxID=1750561 RepID=UPI000730F116|nr:DUF5638 domain-containing protein [Legionella saoudiensis]